MQVNRNRFLRLAAALARASRVGAIGIAGASVGASCTKAGSTAAPAAASASAGPSLIAVARPPAGNGSAAALCDDGSGATTRCSFAAAARGCADYGESRRLCSLASAGLMPGVGEAFQTCLQRASAQGCVKGALKQCLQTALRRACQLPSDQAACRKASCGGAAITCARAAASLRHLDGGREAFFHCLKDDCEVDECLLKVAVGASHGEGAWHPGAEHVPHAEGYAYEEGDGHPRPAAEGPYIEGRSLGGGHHERLPHRDPFRVIR